MFGKAKKYLLFLGPLLLLAVTAFRNSGLTPYAHRYFSGLQALEQRQQALLSLIERSDLNQENARDAIITEIARCRPFLKSMDLWLRYFEPNAYRKLNGPLPVEWETEVFEKFEKPYRREGAGLMLAELYLTSPVIKKDSLLNLIRSSIMATSAYKADSITAQLNTFRHFFLCNRLFLLNLAAIYTTGYECPDTGRILPELQAMLISTKDIYATYNRTFPGQPLSSQYLQLFDRAAEFAGSQPTGPEGFDHFNFIRKYVDPLFAMNQAFIRQYKVRSASYMDYTLRDEATSIFSKQLYKAQNPAGVFVRVQNEKTLKELNELGHLLFYDPILSDNNQRSCASCHKPDQYYSDTSRAGALHFNRRESLPRNIPSLINAVHNHLLMLDGRHLSLQEQARAVICNPAEMGAAEKQVLEKVLSCEEYNKAFSKLLKHTPQVKELGMEHLVSAITFYYSKFSNYYSPFDEVFLSGGSIADSEQKGFNLFMGKAQCGTCHFVPGFSGIRPPYTGNEFEVIGVPADASFHLLSTDSGRYRVHPVPEMLHAFRTTTVRNSEFTGPYMHNGVFKSLEELIDFYDAGGGAGKKLKVDNQTLSQDSLKLTATEKKQLLAFLKCLSEKVIFEGPPASLPKSANASLNSRKPRGDY